MRTKEIDTVHCPEYGDFDSRRIVTAFEDLLNEFEPVGFDPQGDRTTDYHCDINAGKIDRFWEIVREYKNEHG